MFEFELMGVGEATTKQDLNNISSASTLVRLSIDALRGTHSSITTLLTLSSHFRLTPSSLSHHSLFSRAASTHALAKILTAISRAGTSVHLLRTFLHSFQQPPYSIVNQAFSVAVRKVLEGFLCGVDTVSASVALRRGEARAVEEVTLLEVFIHTKELRVRIEALASVCKLGFCGGDDESTFELDHVVEKASAAFSQFPRGGDLLSYLYDQLEFADPVHRALLKFLFLGSCEPYCRFIRSWLYEARISDPYEEFIIKDAPDNGEPCSNGNMHVPSATIREEQAGVVVPCFLRHYWIPLLRAGQQLRVLIKLCELCKFASDDHTCVNPLPSWSGFSSYHPTYASSLTFDELKIEAMVTARSKFYTGLQINLEHILIKLEIRHQQIGQRDTAPVYAGILNRPLSSTIIEGSATSYYIDNKTSISAISALNSNSSTSADEFSCLMDQLDSSECSSRSSSEEENGTEQLFENNSLVGHGPISLSAVSSSSRMSGNDFTDKPPQSNESIPAYSLHEMHGSNSINRFGQLLQYDSDEGKYSGDISASLEEGKENMSFIPGTLCEDYYHDMATSLGSFLKYPFNNDRENTNYGTVYPSKHTVKLRKQIMAVLKEGLSSTDNTPENDQVEHEFHASPNALFEFHKLKYDSMFLSKNPMLTTHALFHLMSEPEKMCLRTEYRQLLSCFDFSSVEDPFKICVKKLDPSPSPDFGVKILQSTVPKASATTVGNSCNDKQAYDETETSVDKCKFIHDTSLDIKVKNAISADISGGSGWERMLAGSDCIVNDKAGDYTPSLRTKFEIPLDFIIDKCLLQEIMLQYKYVSKLTIKLLKEGFNLQDHLMALRRYHFMEVADWVDLFISSLWHQKLYVTGADKRISEIQGLLELSVQRSSCERDHYKNRLFVFMKGQDIIIPLSSSIIGVHAFDFLGLGYRVDWPVSIVLTSAALEIYAEIFNFLLRVKLAIFALTDVWCSMKDMMQVTSQGHMTELNKSKVRQINFLMNMRHQVNHFVITLQQYVLSQLSHVSWSRFLHSLKDMVKDMVDFESVHMEYLMESLHICFLSAETRSVAKIIENILQCALDFQSCFILGIWRVGQDQEDSYSILSHANIEEVLAIKKRFDKELKGLHCCYLKSPKHGDFGLHRLWESINYNDFYSNDI